MAYQNPFSDLEKDSELNPTSQNFGLRAWMENLAGFLQRDVDAIPYRSLGFSFKNLGAYGFKSTTDYQKTVGNIVLAGFRSLFGQKKQRVEILAGFCGVIEAGEMLLVLGRPGSGCSTFLKTISGDTHGFFTTEKSDINYQGISPSQMYSQYRGESVYMAETDAHFPALTVSETLLFAAKARAPPSNTIPGISQNAYAVHMRDLVVSALDLQGSMNTKIGSYIMPGISGGEKKRVSIAEAILSGCPLQCWDNSTRGLDSAVASSFIRILRFSADVMQVTALVSLYQASEDAYKSFDKILLIHEGRQIFFGRCSEAKEYFEDLGYYCPPRKTTADFLTGVTSPQDRQIIPGYENIVPRSAAEFEERWKASPQCAKAELAIKAFDEKHPRDGSSAKAFDQSRKKQQALGQLSKSPYILSFPQQIKLCVDRGFQRLRGDATITISRLGANGVLAVVVGTMFIHLQENTAALTSRSILIFLAILLNAFASALEILLLYEQRPIVEKHARYAWYHPSAEAIASTICDIPFKIGNGVVFNLILYFIANLRQEADAFFVFLIFSLSITFTLSMVFRTFGAISRSLEQALPFSALCILALMTYTGFVVPIHNMPVWFRWINYLDPIAFAFESLMINEFSGRKFDCANFIPDMPKHTASRTNQVCAAIGALPGKDFVMGDDYIRLSYNFEPEHLWRNLGIIFALMAFFTATYLTATEFISAKRSKGDVLLFQRNRTKLLISDAESPFRPETTSTGQAPLLRLSAKFKAHLSKQSFYFQWNDVCYYVKTKSGIKTILEGIDGYVKPGTLTAVMGPSGAGKTTLLNALANRDITGAASGKVLVNGRPRDVSFQRKIGYAQQDDIFLATMTVREACYFNALMCQSSVYSRQEKFDYADEVIKVLGMSSYADAVIGIQGEALNVEQRKKLTVAVELSARLELLLFLDEPTSGLDSQTAKVMIDLLRELSNNGQAIVCTIHQPSAFLFEQFDNLLLLSADGRTVYFGKIGINGSKIIDYFMQNGAKKPAEGANPAEWMLEVLAGTQNTLQTNINWPQVWRHSQGCIEFQVELDEAEKESHHLAITSRANDQNRINGPYCCGEFAAPFTVQFWVCFKRVNQQYWRSPVYIYSKIFSCLGSALFLGLTFYKTDNSLQGLQTQTFSIFMLLSQASTIIPQILPNFVLQRSLYEAREQPAKAYSWQAFLISNILVELPWNTLMAVLIFLAWYFPIGLYRNAILTDRVNERAGLMLLFIWAYMMFGSTFGHMIQSCVEVAEMGANYVNLLFMISLIFCGVLVSPGALPIAWRWVNRVVPFTYIVEGVLSVGLANAPVRCSAIELLHFEPIPGQSCGAYLASYITKFGGYLADPTAVSDCAYCPISSTNDFLNVVGAKYEKRWMDFGLLWIYIVFNVVGALFLYWLVRVPKKGWGWPWKEAADVTETEEELGDDEHSAIELFNRSALQTRT